MVWTVASWVLVALATAAIVRMATSDRARGRRRCPKCWYDMAGTPGMMCPECGRSPSRERSFFRARWRKHWAVLAAVALAGAWGASAAPRCIERGWLAAVPGVVLAGAVAIDGRDLLIEDTLAVRLHEEFQHRAVAEDLGRVAWAVFRQRAEREMAACERHPEQYDGRRRGGAVFSLRMCDAHDQRHGVWDDGTMRALCRASVALPPRWPRSAPLRGMVGSSEAAGPCEREVRFTPRLQSAVATTRMIWPAGTSICGDGRGFSVWTDGSQEIGRLAPGQRTVEFEVEVREDAPDGSGKTPPRAPWHGVISVPVETVEDPASAVPAVPTPELTAALRAGLKPRVLLSPEGGQWAVSLDLGDVRRTAPPTATDALMASPEVTFGARFEVWCGDVQVFTGHAWWRGLPRPWSGLAPYRFDRVPLTMIDTPAAHRRLADSRRVPASLEARAWRINVVADPVMAARDRWAVSRWDGDFEIDIEPPSDLLPEAATHGL